MLTLLWVRYFQCFCRLSPAFGRVTSHYNSVQIIVLTFFIETSDELSLDQTAQAAINSLIPMPTPATTSR